jgi:hypothetical protein
LQGRKRWKSEVNTEVQGGWEGSDARHTKGRRVRTYICVRRSDTSQANVAGGLHQPTCENSD